MTVVVEFFAGAAEIVGFRRAEIVVADNAKVGDLRRAIADQWPRLTYLLAKSNLAVNDISADNVCQLSAGASVAVLPPVSGG